MTVSAELYSLSPRLRQDALAAADNVCKTGPERLRLVEFITLPDYGQRVILRFDVSPDALTSVDEASALEARIRSQLGKDWGATLLGSVYDRLGLRLEGSLDILAAIDRAWPDSMADAPRTAHSDEVKRDAEVVRASLKLDENARVWEIEVPVQGTAGPEVRIVNVREQGEGTLSQDTAVFDDTPCRVLFLRDNRSFTGCCKAYSAAERRQMGVAHYIAGFLSSYG